MLTTQQAKDKATELVNKYPNATNVSDLFDTAIAHGEFEGFADDEGLAVWGRVCRLLPQKENN
jgi:hypothetical protein